MKGEKSERGERRGKEEEEEERVVLRCLYACPIGKAPSSFTAQVYGRQALRSDTSALRKDKNK